MNEAQEPDLLVNLSVLKHVKWNLMADDVHRRIILLGRVVNSLPDDHPLSERIVTDLVNPALESLATFCTSVEMVEEDSQ